MKSSRLVELSKEIENCRVFRNGVIENEDNENSLEERLKELTDFSYGVLNSFGLSSSAQNLQNSSLRGAIITSAILDPEGKLYYYYYFFKYIDRVWLNHQTQKH